MKKVIVLLLLAGCASNQTVDRGHPDRIALDQYRKCITAISATSDINPVSYCSRMSEKF